MQSAHSKPFGAQSPEQIAKDYGGNKQKIAQAMQLGIVDPTVGTLAGMFIDRMAAGAMQSQAPQGTVASQVFNPQTPPAQAPGGTGAGGLPPVPSAAPAPAPQPPMPPQSPQNMQPMGPSMADGGEVGFAGGGRMRSLLPFPEAGLPEGAGFADGGLAALPVPDDMFNSSVGDSDVQQYAPGGIVAFKQGGPLGPWFEEQATEAIPGIRVTSRERSAAHNAQVGGNPHSYHLTNNARDFVPPKDMSMGSLYKRLADLYGVGYDVINEGDHVHVEPGGRRRAPARMVSDPTPAAPASPTPVGLAASELPNEDTAAMYDMLATNTKEREAEKRNRRMAGWAALGQQGLAMLMPQGMAGGGEVPGFAAGTPDPYSPENLQRVQANLGALAPQQHKFSDMLSTDVMHRLDPEELKKDRKQAANQALMNFGLALMASKNPNFLGAVGEAGMPAAAGLKADLNDLKKEAHSAIVEGAQLENYSNKEANEKANRAISVVQSQVSNKHAADTLAEEIRGHTLNAEVEREKMRAEERISTARNAASITAARIGSDTKMDKGLEGLINTYYKQGYNEQVGKLRAKGIPENKIDSMIDKDALRNTAYHIAMPEWQQYSIRTPGIDPVWDPTKRTGAPRPALSPDGFNPNEYVVH